MQQMKLLEVARPGSALGSLERGLVMRAELGADGLVRGIASSYGNADRMDRVLLPGAFGTGKLRVPFLLNHSDNAVLGESLFTPTRDGLQHASDIVGDPLQPGTQVPIRQLLNRGYGATSIGWLPRTQYFGWREFARAEPERAKAAAAQGVVQGEHLRYFGDVELVENSLVPIPANPRALLEAASLLTPASAERAQLEAMVELAAGARHSSSDQAAIQRAHDATVEAGATCDTTDTTPLEPGAPEPGDQADDSGISGGWHEHMRSSFHRAIAATSIPSAAAAVDSHIDAALAALQSNDSAALRQHLEAADTAMDDLMAALKVPDPDEAGLRIIEQAAQMSGSAINNLPDSDFAYIEPGGEKDDQGRTTPRSLRHFPIHDAAHVRNALARAPQSPFGDKAMPKILAAARKFGIDVGDGKSGAAPDLSVLDGIEDLDRELAALKAR